MNFLRKLHKWAGVLVALFIIIFSVSGIIMNHRDFFSPVSVSRGWMPEEYRYQNWNNASVKSACRTDEGYLFYGNLGTWHFNSSLTQYEKVQFGEKPGIDRQKTQKIIRASNGNYYACGLFGLYYSTDGAKSWEEIELPTHEKIIDLTSDETRVYVLSRSELFHLDQNTHQLRAYQPATPADYDNKIGLFRTLWEIHSGEFIGLPGKLLVDLMGLIFLALSITGIVYFVAPHAMKRSASKVKKKWGKARRFSLKWHNWLGVYPVVFLLITTITGMFLRPPLLIPIANQKVNKLPFTHLDHPNPWYDQLRSIYYDTSYDALVLGTSNGFYYSKPDASELYKIPIQPPVSVMGVNVFEKTPEGNYLVGSFSGLFEWNPMKGIVFDRMENRPYRAVSQQGPPIGAHVIAGYFKDRSGEEWVFDYSAGVKSLGSRQTFIPMPALLEASPMSLWNLALEFHTARFYQFMLGPAYILIVPLVGLIIILLLVSGILVWIRYHTGKKKSRVNSHE